MNNNLFVKDTEADSIWTVNFNRLVSLAGIESSQLKNIGFIYNPYIDKIVFGHRVAFQTEEAMRAAFDYKEPDQSQLQAYSYLQSDGDFYQSEDGETLKVFSSVDPNISVYDVGFNKPVNGGDSRAVQELWFATGGSFIVHPHDCEIRDIKITGFGRSAIEGGQDNVVVENVKVDLVGGMAQELNKIDTSGYVRLGNGIEIWMSTIIPQKNVLVRGCEVSRVFDAGLTLQGNLDNQQLYGTENVVFEDNVVNNCRMSFEGFCYYVRDNVVIGAAWAKDCYFKHNLAYNDGMNGFNSPGRMDHQIAAITQGVKISCNLFYNGNLTGRFSDRGGADFGFGNICYIRPGQYLMQESMKYRDYVYYPENPTKTNVAEAVARYRAMARDNHTMIVGITSPVSEINN